MSFKNTIKRSVSCSGIGTHSGKPARLRIHPAPVDFGIRFVREDIANVSVPAIWTQVTGTLMCTCISKDNVMIKTVEHLMAALQSMGVDNALIELDSEEVPIFDGSALKFTELIKSAELSPQFNQREYIKVLDSITIQDNNRVVSISHSDKNMLSLEVELDLSKESLGNQSISLDLSPDAFISRIAPARTFGFLKDVKMLLDQGLIKGSSLENAVVIDNGKIMNPNGLRFKDEMVRHKALDAIGDLSLAGKPIIGKFYGKNCSHTINQNLLKKLLSTPSAWQLCA
ncbi:MAG: UDP-3-O-acyl-N-acetylglucosamine deacetylase [Holosporales bacterium]|jgi:UDP-3-O-[3-hydroxymyristoyl] N-acetylglucosamine deacetylase|nr:UDP-3-O-acyl-N-acetylglucosamine deacetylase [Holosporales bacterium]